MPRRLSFQLANLLFACGLVARVHAAELGDVKVNSFVGQHLSADIELTALDDPAAAVQVRLASLDVYRGANLDMPAVLASLNLSVARRDGKQFLHVTSTRPVDADHLHLYLELTDGNRRGVRLATLWFAPDPTPPAPPERVAIPMTASTATATAPAQRRKNAPVRPLPQSSVPRANSEATPVAPVAKLAFNAAPGTGAAPAAQPAGSAKPSPRTESSAKSAPLAESSAKPAPLAESSAKPAPLAERSAKPAPPAESSAKPATLGESSTKPNLGAEHGPKQLQSAEHGAELAQSAGHSTPAPESARAVKPGPSAAPVAQQAASAGSAKPTAATEHTAQHVPSADSAKPARSAFASEEPHPKLASPALPGRTPAAANKAARQDLFGAPDTKVPAHTETVASLPWTPGQPARPAPVKLGKAPAAPACSARPSQAESACVALDSKNAELRAEIGQLEARVNSLLEHANSRQPEVSAPATPSAEKRQAPSAAAAALIQSVAAPSRSAAGQIKPAPAHRASLEKAAQQPKPAAAKTEEPVGMPWGWIAGAGAAVFAIVGALQFLRHRRGRPKTMTVHAPLPDEDDAQIEPTLG